MTGFNIAEVFSESLRFVLRQLRAVLVLAAVPYLLLLAALILIDQATADVIAQAAADMAALQDYMMQADPASAEQATIDAWSITLPSGQVLDFGPMLLANLATVLALTIVPLPFRVAWLRYSLLGPQAQPVRPGYAFGPRVLRFLGYSIGVMLIMMLILLGFAIIGSALGGGGALLFMLGGMIVTIWVGARLYFMFPIVAMDLPGGLGRAWRESRGQAFKLLLLTLLVGLVFLLPTIVVGLALGQVPFVGTLALLLVQVVAEAALWTALGFAYWKTTGIPGSGGSVSAQTSE